MNKPCPICEKALETWCTSDAPHGTMEEGERCKECKYSYEFSHGSYQAKVGNLTWSWHYDTEQRIIMEARAEIEKAIEKAKNGQ